MKEILEKILENYKSDLIDQPKASRQILALTGYGENLNYTQIDKVNKMLKKNSQDSWIAAKGSIDGWKEWYAERSKLNINKAR